MAKRSVKKRSGLLSTLLGNNKKSEPNLLRTYFGTLGGYSPVYTSYDGGIYELGLCRACINTIATACSKTTPEIVGDSRKNRIYSFLISKKPNPYMTASQFYKRLATAYFVENNAFIIPIEDEYGTLTGLWPAVPSQVTLKSINQVTYAVYDFADGTRKCIEYSKIGHLRQMQYKNDFFGESNSAFNSTGQLLITQEEGATAAIKSSSVVRFFAKLNTVIADDEDYKEQQDLISRNNLNQNDSGVFLVDSRYEDVKPIEGKPLLVDATQKQSIENSVFNYFGISESILQNKYSPEMWNAFYESKIEPFFIECGEVLTCMLFSVEQMMKHDCAVILTSDRLQYDSTDTKITVATQLFDRGATDIDGVLNIMNKAPLPNGEGKKRFIRGEYIQVDELKGGNQNVKEREPESNEDAFNELYNDNRNNNKED